MQNSDKILTRYRHHTCKFKHVCMCLYLFQKCRHHTGSIETQYCSGEIHIHTHSSTYMHILFCLYWIQTCMYPIQTCMYDVCMCMYFFAHTYKISQLLCCLYVLKNTYKYKHAGSLMIPCIYMDIPRIYLVDIRGISMDIYEYTTYIPCILVRTAYTWYTRHIPGIYWK